MISPTIERQACMTTGKLGKLKQIDLHNVWKKEANDFTPWLVEEEKLNDLGDLLAIPLEFLAEQGAKEPTPYPRFDPSFVGVYLAVTLFTGSKTRLSVMLEFKK